MKTPNIQRAKNARPLLWNTHHDQPESRRAEVVALLNAQLADVIDLGLQAKQAHWNVKGPQFAALHALFDEVREELDGFADELAERAVVLGGVAKGTAQVLAADSRLAAYPLSALAGGEHVCEQSLPVLAEYLQWFGSPLIKNAGTLAGNLATASPIGDMTPPLIALDAEVELMSITGTRRVPMSDFITGYRKTVLRPDEIIASVHIPIPSSYWLIRFYKIAKRKDLDISTVSAAIAMRLANGSIDDVRIVMGGVGPTALRLTRTEQLLLGQAPSLDLFVRAAGAARSEVAPITDVRGSEQYRRAVAGNLLLKFFHEAIGQPEGVA